MENKKYSFEKKKVVDAEFVETDSEGKNNKSSFTDKLKGQGSAFAKGSKILAEKAVGAYKEYNKPENVLKRKEFTAKKTELDAKIAKNKAEINKHSNHEIPKGGFGMDWSLGNNNKDKKKKGGGGLFDGDLF